MAEMRRIGIANVLRQMREIDVLVDEMQQMPRPLPGAECAERDAGLLLEQMQEARRRQANRCGAVGRGHLDAAEIVEFRSRRADPAVDIALGQILSETELVEVGGGKAAAARART